MNKPLPRLYEIRTAARKTQSDDPREDPKPYQSCKYVEGGLSFTYSEIQACATRHHGRGAPFLQDMRGKDPQLNLETILQSRKEIQESNRDGGHPECVGCPNLQYKKWPRSKYLFNWIAITNYIHCNLRCTFCWLTYAPHSPYNSERKMDGQRYAVAPLIRELMQKQLLDPDGIVDWGGGGEPTLIPEFDQLFDELAQYGVKQVLHTNAVKLPRSAIRGSLNARKLQIMCSIDAGSRESYAKLKGRDRFETVLNNLVVYRELGATVDLKYIMQDSNSTPNEIDQFVRKAKTLGFKSIVSDVDHREPALSEQIIEALRYMKRSAQALGLRSRFSGCGAHGADRKLFRELNEPARKNSLSTLFRSQ